MRPSSSSSSADRRSTKRSKANPKTPLQRSPFTDFGSYMKEKNRKLRSQFQAEASSSSIMSGETSYSGGRTGIFHGVSIFVDGHTVPSSQELRGHMLRHGGRYENYFSRTRVTHIICSNLPDSKMRNLRAFSRGLPVLKPSWVVDSVAANKLLSWQSYVLAEHSSEICKQQKLSAFFGCKSISSLKGVEVLSDSNKGTDPENLGKFKNSHSLQENKELGRRILLSERIELGLDTEEKNTSLLDKGAQIETSDSSSLQLFVQSNSCAAEDFGELTNTKCLQTSDVHHSTLTDPNFVENYFKHSRLHFIGTWRNRYRKRFFNMLKRECCKSTVVSSTSTNKTSIIHIDMDSFFVSVILRKYPELLDKPVAVCHSNNSRGTAEISSANYPARNYGISAGMFVRDAIACCPNLVVFPYDFEAYEEVADQFYSILHKHCSKVQALSCDEAFLDISESDLDPESFSSLIRKEIEETTQCTASAGIAGNLLMARLATKIAKPNGQCYIPPEKVETFLDDLPITALSGIGRAIGDKLESMQLHTCGQLRLISKEILHKDFGAKVGDMLWNYCRGIDDRKVEGLKETKSIGAEVNWGVRFLNTMDCEHFLNNLSKEVSSRLHECGVVARTINLKVKRRRVGAKEPLKFMGCGDCENMSRSMTLPVATDDATLIQRTAKQIFASYHIDVKEVRGVGLQMSKLEVGTNRQGHKHNVLESWLSVSAKVGEELVGLENQMDATVDDSLSSGEDQLAVQPNVQVREYSPLCIDRDASSSPLHVNLCNSRPYQNASPALPPVCLLDMSVIKDLPVDIISEMNDAYNGKLYDLIRKHDEDQELCAEIHEGKVVKSEAKFEATKSSGSTSRELNHPEKAGGYEMSPHQVKLQDILQIKSTTCTDQMVLTSGSSSKAFSIMQNLSDGNLDKSALAQGVPSHFASVADDTHGNNPNPIGPVLSDTFKINLWSGSPPKWVDKFEVSNSLILNLTAQLYAKYGVDKLLSPILQLLISLYPLIVGSSSEEPLEVRFDLCELLLQYIELKIDSDVEELYLCYLLLERLASMSTVFSEVRDIVLPSLQASVSENYGGTFQLTGSGD